MLLDSHEAVHKMIEEFDPGNDVEITHYFRDHGVEPTGLVHYAFLMSRAAVDSAETGDNPLLRMMAIFSGGVALGLHLADVARSEAATA